jgi:hypothetical protein
VAALAILVAVGLALYSRWSQVQGELAKINGWSVALALVCILVALQFSMASWHAVLAGLGSPLPTAGARRIFFVGQLGKYLPGSVWPVVVQMDLGRSYGVPASRMAVSFVVSLGVSVLTGSLVGAPALWWLGDDLAWLRLPAVVLAGLGLAILARPGLLNRLLATMLRLLRRPPLAGEISSRALLRSGACLLGAWLMFGASVWLLAMDVGGDPLMSLRVAIPGYALSFTAGLLFILAPAGVGVRDALLVVVLAPVIGLASATAVAVVARLLATVADVAAAGWGIASRKNAAGKDGRHSGVAQ